MANQDQSNKPQADEAERDTVRSASGSKHQ